MSPNPMIDFLKRIFKKGLAVAAVAFILFGATAAAQTVSQLDVWKKVGGALQPRTPGQTVGSSSLRITEGWFDELNATTADISSLSFSGTVSGNLDVSGTIEAGSGNTTLTDAAGKILSAALNTVGVGQGGTGTSTQFTQGSVVFAGASGVYTQDNTSLFFDNSNNRLGILTASPLSTIDNNGTLATDGTTAVGSTGLNWRVATSTAYAAGIENTNNGTTSHGLFLKVANSSAFPLRTSGGVALLGGGGTTTGSTTAEAFGIGATANNDNTVAIGPGANTTAGNHGIAVGRGAAGSGTSFISLGEASSAGTGQFVAGSSVMSITDLYFGKGVTSSSPPSVTLNGTGGSGTNIAGANLILAGGKGTGNAAGGKVILQTSTAGGSGTTLQSLADTWQLQAAGGSVGHNTTPNSLITYGLQMASPNVVGLRVTGPGGGATYFSAMDGDNTVASASAKTSGNYILFGHTHRADSGTPSDNYETYLFKRGSTANGGSITAAGTVMTLSNTNTLTSGTVTDTVTVLKAVQDSNSTGQIFSGVNGSTEVFGVGPLGGLTISPTAALTTGITLTDSDLTNALSIADNNIVGTTAAIDFTNFDVGTTGNLDAGGTLTAGSGNEVLTLSTGKIDADAITLVSATNGLSGTSSASGLAVHSDGLSLLQGCSDGQMLKWVESTDTWDCAVAASGVVYSKNITIENPTASEDFSMFYSDDAITVTKMVAVVVGSSSPSITWTARHSTDRSASGNEVVTSGTTTTSTTTGSVVTSFNDATIPGDSFVWLESTALSGVVNSVNVTIFYTVD